MKFLDDSFSGQRFAVLCCAMVLATALPSSPAHAWLWGLFDSEEERQSEDKPYEVSIVLQGENEALEVFTEKMAETLNKQGIEEQNHRYVRYRLQQDLNFIQQSLKAKGYYDATVEKTFDENKGLATFSVSPGEQYQFGKVQTVLHRQGAGNMQAILLPSADALKARAGKPALTRFVIEDQAAIEKQLEDEHCLFSHETRHKAVLHRIEKTLDITYYVEAGPEVEIGDIRFTGQETLEPDYMARLVPLEQGQCFKRSKLNSAKVKLQKSSLLSVAKLKLPETAPEDGKVPVVFEVTEGAQRSVKAGVNYSTDIGPGFTAGWEHRNYFGRGEKVNADLSVSTIEQTLSLGFGKPYFLRDDQKLRLNATIEREDSDAFTTTGFTVGGNIERDLGNDWNAGVGVSYGFEQIKDQNSTENSAVLSFPLFTSADKRDDPLHSTKGWTLNAKTAPAIDTLGDGTSYVKSSAAGTFYQAVPIASEPVIALRAAGGAITGASTDDIPATKRFYSGGGGSIRGYGYQLAGPLDADGDPLGGRSFLEFSTEARFRVYDDYGFVAFVDGGSAFDSAYPDFEEDLLFGAGIGFRYFTDFGPLRADIAIPLDKREGVDDSFQLYFSIGQAF